MFQSSVKIHHSSDGCYSYHFVTTFRCDCLLKSRIVALYPVNWYFFFCFWFEHKFQQNIDFLYSCISVIDHLVLITCIATAVAWRPKTIQSLCICTWRHECFFHFSLFSSLARKSFPLMCCPMKRKNNKFLIGLLISIAHFQYYCCCWFCELLNTVQMVFKRNNRMSINLMDWFFKFIEEKNPSILS